MAKQTPEQELQPDPAPAGGRPPFMARDRMMLHLIGESIKDFFAISRSSPALIVTYLSFVAALVAGLFSDQAMSIILLFVTTPAAGFAAFVAYMATLTQAMDSRR